jgi:hypothetical protein
MKLSQQVIDPAKLEQGDWVESIPEMGDLRLKVKGARNRAWERMQRTLIDAVPRKKKIGGRIDDDEQARITSILLRDTCLIDWSGLEDDEGKAIPYSKDFANTLLTDPQYRNFRDAVMWAATVVAEQRGAEAEDTAKN